MGIIPAGSGWQNAGKREQQSGSTGNGSGLVENTVKALVSRFVFGENGSAASHILEDPGKWIDGLIKQLTETPTTPNFWVPILRKSLRKIRHESFENWSDFIGKFAAVLSEEVQASGLQFALQIVENLIKIEEKPKKVKRKRRKKKEK